MGVELANPFLKYHTLKPDLKAHTALTEFNGTLSKSSANSFTYMLVLAVDVSQSAANPTISNPVES